MRSTVGLLTMIVATLAALAAEATVQEPKVEYSADAYMETAEMVMQGPVHIAPGKERREYVMDGTKMVTIVRRDKQLIWSLMPDDEMYTEMRMTESKSPTDLGGYSIEQTAIGPETVNGVATNKKKIVMTSSDGTKLGGFMWVTDEGIVVKMDAIAVDKKSKERVKSELKNLRIGRQEASLFEIPAGYTRMDMTGIGAMMMGGDDGGDDEGAGNGEPTEAPQPKPKKKRFGFKDAVDLVK